MSGGCAIATIADSKLAALVLDRTNARHYGRSAAGEGLAQSAALGVGLPFFEAVRALFNLPQRPAA